MDLIGGGVSAVVGGQVIGAASTWGFSKLGYIPRWIKAPWKFGSRLLHGKNPLVNPNLVKAGVEFDIVYGGEVANEISLSAIKKPKGLASITVMDIGEGYTVTRPFQDQFLEKIRYVNAHSLHDWYYTIKARYFTNFKKIPGFEKLRPRKVYVRRAKSIIGKNAIGLETSRKGLWRFKARSGKEYLYFTKGSARIPEIFKEECFHSVQRKAAIMGWRPYNKWFSGCINRPFKPISEYGLEIEQDAQRKLSIYFEKSP